MPAKTGALRGLPCSAGGCVERTTGGKSYCQAHLHRMPYVASHLSHLPGVQERMSRDPGLVVSASYRGDLQAGSRSVLKQTSQA